MLASPAVSNKNIYYIVAAYVLIASLSIRFVVWYLELSQVIPATNFTSVLAILVILIVGARTVIIRRRHGRVIDWLPIVMLLYCGGVVYRGYIERGDYMDSEGVSFTAFNVAVLFQSILYYIIGRFFLGDSLARRSILLYGWLFLNVFILANSSISPFGLNLERMDDKVRGIYLSLADMYALLSILIVATEEKSKKAWRLVFISAVFLFLLHSRGAFLIFMMSASIALSRLSLVHAIKMAVWLIFFIMVIIFFGWEYVASNERMIGILTDPLNDSSLQSRLIQMAGGFQDIENNPVFGRYGGQIEMYGYRGWYIHSILSYWRQFGSLPFIGIVILSFYTPLRIFLKVRGIPSRYRTLLLMLTVYCTIQSIFVKAYEWYFLWMFIGYVGWLQRWKLCASNRTSVTP